MRAVWEPDGVLEFPYGESVGIPPRLEGIDAIVDYFSGLGVFGAWSFRDIRGSRVADSSEYVLEMHGSSTVKATDAPYEQDYVVRFGLSAAGKVAWMREFWDPTRLG